MKTIYKTRLAVLIIIGLLLTSCSEDDSAPVDNNSTPAGAFVKGKVDGVQFENTQFQGNPVVSVSRTGTGDQTEIMVMGMNAEMDAMGFIMHGVTTTGTYNLDEVFNVGLLYESSETDLTYDTGECNGATGILIITHFDDTKIEGTFEFTGKYDEDCDLTKTITEGSFRGLFP